MCPCQNRVITLLKAKVRGRVGGKVEVGVKYQLKANVQEHLASSARQPLSQVPPYHMGC